MGMQLTKSTTKMKYLIVLVIALAATQAYDLDSEWESFKIKYGKNLQTGQEHDIRKSIFANNLKFIEKHNAEHDLGIHTFTVAINQFADLTNEEFVKQFTGFAASKNLPESSVEVVGELPDSIDWREKGAVTPVRNQGSCGSCWAFSTTGAIEGAYFIKTGKLVSLSEQNLMDCNRKNGGCDGGIPYYALEYVIQNGGIDTESSYPYKIKEGSEQDLQNAIGSIGPVSIGVNAACESFQFY